MTDADPSTDEPAAARPKLLLGGYAPLVVALVLIVLAIILVPSVAPEQVVVGP